MSALTIYRLPCKSAYKNVKVTRWIFTNAARVIRTRCILECDLFLLNGRNQKAKCHSTVHVLVVLQSLCALFLQCSHKSAVTLCT